MTAPSTQPKKRNKRPRGMFRVVKGGFEPADTYTASLMRERNFKIGDLIMGDITKPRNPKFHFLAHQLGTLVAQNIEAFTGVESHEVLKRLQREGNIACTEQDIEIPGFGTLTARMPDSLSFESMDQGQFYAVVRQFCNHIVAKYWPTLAPEQIEEMIGVMVEPV